MSYPTAAEAKLYAYQYDADGSQGRASDDEMFPLLATRASRLFDSLCNRPSGYFAVADLEGSGDTSEERVFYGDGTNYLLVDPHAQPIDAGDVELPVGYTAPTFVDKDGYLIVTDSKGVLPSRTAVLDWWTWAGWPDGCPVTVTSVWGFAETQEDVKEAILELIISIWRSKDTAFARAIDLGGAASGTQFQIINEALPQRTREVIQRRQFFDKALVA